MAEIEAREIANWISARTKRAVLAMDGEFKPRIARQGVGLRDKRDLRLLGLIEAEDAQRGVWNYRLTSLGIEVQAALRAMLQEQGE